MSITNNKRLVIWGIVMLFTIMACSIVSPLNSDGPPAASGPTRTPNLTLTAIFKPFDENEIDPSALATQDPNTQPTATLATTATLIPAESATPGDPDEESTPETSTEMRAGPSIQSFFQIVAPVIDGDPGDWDSTVYPLNNLVFGEEFYAGEKDLSGEFKMGWDQDFLYAAVVVRDTKFVQNAIDAQLYQGDSLEILLDTDVTTDFFDDTISDDDFQLGFSPGNLNDGGSPEGYIWTPREKSGVLTKMVMASRLTEDGYIIELGIPWIVIDVPPAANLHLGFLLSVSDNDSPGLTMQQSVVSFGLERQLHNPTTWHDLHLLLPIK
ncbi:MAG: hypothetical protein N2D54_10145 [Chloroflexota bacterium]